MKRLIVIGVLGMALTLSAKAQQEADVRTSNYVESEMLVRISEIEVYPEHLSEYLTFARNVGAESVRKEPGVIAIYPMVQKRDSCQIRILEIYADQEAYKKHIASEHFQTYKQSTLHMVKSLDLVDMTPMNPDGMKAIFCKMK